eukprot:TRINITY_DN36002_c0_g1_i1.p1 TRINITY_DN36002_c0_g1~~TRINITY_DN36002_c0_g1_i1.p1  ORF type:complete len:214 (-),score=47.84 TRINITY_DN36002_c0_g1_i1:405-1046(-)
MSSSSANLLRLTFLNTEVVLIAAEDQRSFTIRVGSTELQVPVLQAPAAAAEGASSATEATEGFEVISATAAQALAASVCESATSPLAEGEPAPPSQEWSWQRREERARLAGVAALRVLRGEWARPGCSEQLPSNLRNRVYIVLRPAARFQRGQFKGLCGSWALCAQLVTTTADSPELCNAAVFHGFASLREANRYWQAAGLQLPIPQLQAPGH